MMELERMLTSAEAAKYLADMSSSIETTWMRTLSRVVSILYNPVYRPQGGAYHGH